MAIGIQNQCIEHEHAPKHILSSEFFIQFQQSRYTIRVVGKIADFRKAVRLIREQAALGDQFLMIEPQIVMHRLWTNLLRKLTRKELGQRLNLIGIAAALVQINAVCLAHPAFRVIAVCAELRRSGGKRFFADDTAECRLRDERIKLVPVKRNLIPAERFRLLFHPKCIVERQRMRHTQKALQTDTAVLLEKLLDVLTMLGCLALFKPCRQRLQADWPQVGIPLTKNSTLLAKFVLLAGEQRTGHVFIH